MTDDDDDDVSLMLSLNEMPGQPAAYDTIAEAMAALAQLVDIDPSCSVELHDENCEDTDRCDCPRLTMAELMPSAKA